MKYDTFTLTNHLITGDSTEISTGTFLIAKEKLMQVILNNSNNMQINSKLCYNNFPTRSGSFRSNAVASSLIFQRNLNMAV